VTHSGDVNKSIYQTPLAEAEILHVGAKLEKMDGQMPSSSPVICDTGGWSKSPAYDGKQAAETAVDEECSGSQRSCDDGSGLDELATEPAVGEVRSRSKPCAAVGRHCKLVTQPFNN